MPRRKAPVPPPAEILNLIRQQVSDPAFLRDLTVWTDRQCGRLLSLEDRHDPSRATDLIHAAVVDTCTGVRIWNPAARTLRRHLEQTINSRLWHECDRMRRRRFITLSAVSVDDSHDPAVAIEVEMSERREDPRTRPDRLLAQRETRVKVFAALRQRAARDEQLLDLLDAYEAGHSRQADAEASVGVRGQAFQNLVRRFKTVRGHLPPELRDAALDMIHQEGGAPLPAVSRRHGRLVETLASSDVANDSYDEASATSESGDGDVTDDGEPSSEAA